MRHTLYFTFDDVYDGMEICEFDYHYIVEENIQDIIEYEFEKKYGKKYDVLSWYTYPGSETLVSNLKDLYLRNAIDFLSYFQNPQFISWMKEKYYYDALRERAKKGPDYYHTLPFMTYYGR